MTNNGGKGGPVKPASPLHVFINNKTMVGRGEPAAPALYTGRQQTMEIYTYYPIGL